MRSESELREHLAHLESELESAKNEYTIEQHVISGGDPSTGVAKMSECTKNDIINLLDGGITTLKYVLGDSDIRCC